jgi:hypothetical protein
VAAVGPEEEPSVITLNAPSEAGRAEPRCEAGAEDPDVRVVDAFTVTKA